MVDHPFLSGAASRIWQGYWKAEGIQGSGFKIGPARDGHGTGMILTGFSEEAGGTAFPLGTFPENLGFPIG